MTSGTKTNHRTDYQRRRTLSDSSSHLNLERVTFNIGNRQFEIPVCLLEKAASGSRLHNFVKQTTVNSATHVETDVFRNRDPGLFLQVVQFIESKTLSTFGVDEYKSLLEEAKFFKLSALEQFLEKEVFQRSEMERPFSRRDKRRPGAGSKNALNKLYSRQDRDGFSDNVFEEGGAENDRKAFSSNNRNRNFYSYRTADFGLADLLNDAPLRRPSYDWDGGNSDDYNSIDDETDNLKLGREFYLYKKELMKNPRAEAPKLEESHCEKLLRPPNVNKNTEIQYRPRSRKEPAFYKIEEPKFSHYKVKAWIQDTDCACKKRGLERYIQNYLRSEVETTQWKDTETNRCEDKWRTVIRDWFRVYNVSCEHRMSSCTLDIEFTSSIDKINERKLKAYLQSFGRLNHVLFDYSIEGRY